MTTEKTEETKRETLAKVRDDLVRLGLPIKLANRIEISNINESHVRFKMPQTAADYGLNFLGNAGFEAMLSSHSGGRRVRWHAVEDVGKVTIRATSQTMEGFIEIRRERDCSEEDMFERMVDAFRSGEDGWLRADDPMSKPVPKMIVMVLRTRKKGAHASHYPHCYDYGFLDESGAWRLPRTGHTDPFPDNASVCERVTHWRPAPSLPPGLKTVSYTHLTLPTPPYV